MQRWRANMALVLVTAIWGSTFVIVKNAIDIVEPLVLIASRFWVAGGVLLVAFLIRRSKGDMQLLRDGMITGCILTAGFVTQTFALQTTEAAKTAFITGLSVVVVPVFAALLLRHAPSRAAVVGVALATVGMGLLTLDRSLRLASGDLWALACALCFALHIIITAHFSPKHAVLPFTLVQLFTVALLATLATLLLGRRAASVARLPTPAVLPAIVYLGVAATAFVFGAQTWGQRHTTPTHTALIFSLEPVFAALFALAFAGEGLVAREWAGGGLILLGMLVAELVPARGHP